MARNIKAKKNHRNATLGLLISEPNNDGATPRIAEKEPTRIPQKTN